MFIYLDESGDLGFDWNKANTSRFFTITLLVCKSATTTKAFKTAIKRTLRNKVNKPNKRNRLVMELKGTDTSLSVKTYFFRHAPKEGWELYSLTLNKKRAYQHLTTTKGKQKTYNFLTRHLIVQLIPLLSQASHVNLILDCCKNASEIKDFDQYIKGHLESILPLQVPLYISHENSQENPCLQVADLFCWGIARNWNSSEDHWFREFSKMVRYNEKYLP